MSDLQSSKTKKILAERAALIAAEKQEISGAIKTALVVFEVGAKQKYGIAYNAITKIIENYTLTPIPGANKLFSGVIYYDVEVWPVVNSNVLFQGSEESTHSNLILLRSGAYRYALAVGEIIGQIPFDESLELFHLPTDSFKEGSYALGIYQTDITLVDAEVVFNILNDI